VAWFLVVMGGEAGDAAADARRGLVRSFGCGARDRRAVNAGAPSMACIGPRASARRCSVIYQRGQ